MTTFGPQEGPPQILCVLCDFGIPHDHHHGTVPLMPCRACFVGVHDMCDPTTWWCCCLYCFDGNPIEAHEGNP